MSRKKIKILSSCFALLLLIAAVLLSDSRSSYLSPFTKNNSESDSVQELEQVEYASVTPAVTPKEESAMEEVFGESTSEGAETYRVTKVVDGDTLEVDDSENSKIRVIGIDTPETVDPRKSVQCFGKEASNKAKEMLLSQFVTLVADESQGNKDKYGRLLRYITLSNGSDFGLAMISGGYAHEYTYSTPYQKQAEYKQAEIDARNENLGLWSTSTCSGDK